LGDEARPLAHVGQLRLEEVTGIEEDLPNAGLLTFFAEFDPQLGEVGVGETEFDPQLGEVQLGEVGVGEILYSRPGKSLLRASPPTDASPPVFSALGVGFAPDFTIPPFESSFVERLALSEAEQDGYFRLDELIHGSAPSDEPVHRVLGYPDQIQDDLQVLAELPHSSTAAAERVEGWRLLLQVDSDPRLGMEIGDGGRLYFMIHDDDLKRGAFEGVQLLCQMS